MVLLDLGLPDMDGLEVIRHIRSWSQLPIIVLSARTSEEEKVRALDLGADDYITKPFGTSELLARIRTALRHSSRPTAPSAASSIYHAKQMKIDFDRRLVTVNGKEVKKVMVDGKEFFSDDPKVASKNLPAKMIDKLQVLDKKSDMAQMTGFDDGEEETVINLTVKPGMKQGWFGNAYGGYGSKDRYEGNAMVNRFVNNDQITFMGGANNTNNMGFSDLASTMFSGMGGGGGRRGGFGAGSGITSSGNAGLNFSKEFKPDKLTLGGNTRYSHSDNDARSKSDRQNILPGDSSSYDNSEAMSRTKSDNFGVDFRLEWKPDTMTQLIFRPSFSFSHSMNDNFSDATTLDNERDTVNTNKSSNYSESNGYNLNASIDFSRKLNNKGRVFSATLSGGNSDSYSDGMNRSDIVISTRLMP